MEHQWTRPKQRCDPGDFMCSVPSDEPAAERARCLADLSDALNDAHQLLIRLDLCPNRIPGARELYLRIEAARLEVQSLRLSRSLTRRKDNGPEWTESLPWRKID